MLLNINQSSVVVFDLDDTLYKEVDYVVSAYRQITQQLCPAFAVESFEGMWNCFANSSDAFSWLINNYAPSSSIPQLLDIYRYHTPTLLLPEESRQLLTKLNSYGVKLGVITDGRKRTQMNKLKALGIIDLFQKIVISEDFGSEKPCEANYRDFELAFPSANYCYIGDNPRKDFIAPNNLGWTTVAVANDGRNIHPTVCDLPKSNYAQYTVNSLAEIILSFGT